MHCGSVIVLWRKRALVYRRGNGDGDWESAAAEEKFRLCEGEASGGLPADRVFEGPGSARVTSCGEGGVPNQPGTSGGRTAMPASKGTQELIRGSIDSGRSAEDVVGAATGGRTGMDSECARGTSCGRGGGPYQSGTSGGRTSIPASKGTQELIRGGDDGLLIRCVQSVNALSGCRWPFEGWLLSDGC